MSTKHNHTASGTNAPGADKDQAQVAPEGTAMDSLKRTIAEIQARSGLPPLAPKSIHQVIQDIVDEFVPQMTQPTDQTIYVEPKYSLSTAALIHIQTELQSIIGPAVAITVFKQQIDNNHVLFQFKT